MRFATPIAALILGAFLAAPARAADWTEYRIGPLYVLSNAGDRDARARLTEMEQIRWVLGERLGKQDLQAIWPITLVLFDDRDDARTYALKAPFVEGGSAMLSVAYKDDAPTPQWRSAIVRQLIEGNAGRMPDEIETAIADLFSTIQVEDATRVLLGAPPPAGSVPEDRRLAWEKLHLLAVDPEYAGRFRIYLNNLQGGDADLAARNTFGVSAAELDRRMQDYAARGVFEAQPVFGEALDPRKAFYERRMEDSEVEALRFELRFAGSAFPPDSPRGLMAEGTADAARRAAALNPRWGEPHFRLAQMETNPEAKASRLLKAVELEPRKVEYWEALAEAQSAAGQYREASRSWIGAERAAPTEAEKERLRQRRRDIEEARVEAELAAARQAREERERHVEEVKAASDARIQAALDAANRANREESGLDEDAGPGDEAVSFEEAFGGTETVRGLLTSVGCINGWLRLAIEQTGGELAILRMVPPKSGADGETGFDEAFACGAKDPGLPIQVVHDGKPDERLGTSGTIESFELR